MIRTVLNAVSFQANWFVVILCAAAGWAWVGILTSLVFIGAWAAAAREPRRVLRLAAVCGVIGYACDSVLVLGGWLGFPPEAQLGGPATIWMVALWIAIAGTLDGCLGWMRGRPAIAAMFGLFGGAGSYYAGMRLGAVTFPSGDVAGLVASGVEWALAMPLLAACSTRLDPRGPEGTTS